MSTAATLEPPKPATPDPNAAPAGVVPAPVAPIIFEGGLEGILKKANPKKPADVKPPEQKKDEKTPEEIAAEKKAASDKAAADKAALDKAALEKKDPPAPGDKSLETNLVKLREELDTQAKGRKTAEEELTKIRTEVETLRKNPVPDDVQKRIADLEKANGELVSFARAAARHRDPQFVQKYQTGRQSLINGMFELAKSNGIDEQEAMAAFRAGGSQLAELAERLPAGVKLDFQGSLLELRNLDRARSAELEESDQQWQERLKAQEAQAKEAQRVDLETRAHEVKGVLSDFFKIEGLPDDPEFRTEIEKLAKQAAGLEESAEPWDNTRWIKNVVLNQALGRATQELSAKNEALTAQMAEKDKKIAELEAFVKEQSGSVIRTAGNGSIGGGANSDKRPIWEQIKVRVPGT